MSQPKDRHILRTEGYGASGGQGEFTPHVAAVRHAILQVRYGPMACSKAVIAPGQVLRVGRGEAVNLAVPHDKDMAEVHFELSWSGSRAWLKDLGSSTGTLLEGQKIEQGEVFNGSWIRASLTDFSVYFERTTPPRKFEEPSLSPMWLPQKTWALQMLHEQEANLYAIMDAARSGRILELLRESVEEYRSLYEGMEGDFLEDVAPYLVKLPKGSLLLEALVQEGWGDGWGIYLTSSQPFLDIRRHLRKFLMVETEGTRGRRYFRFYDPRVIRLLWPELSPDECRNFLGPIECLIFENSYQAPVCQPTTHSDKSSRPVLFITKNQLSVLARSQRQAFADKIAGHLATIYPDDDRSEIRKIAWEIVDFCHEVNITSQRLAATIMQVVVHFGRDVLDRSAVNIVGILRDKQRDQHERVNELRLRGFLPWEHSAGEGDDVSDASDEMGIPVMCVPDGDPS